MVKKFGFTLAEVLITLGIIGVIAALTLPSLIQKKQTKELETGLKVAYSLINQAIINANNGAGETLTSKNVEYRQFKSLIMPYFDNPTDCSWGGNKGVTNSIICGGADDSSNEVNINYKNFSKKSQSISTRYIDDGQFVLKNGMLIMIENEKTPTVYLTADINGASKKPNAWGHDVFTFQLMDNGKLLPMGQEGTDFYNRECSETSTGNINGIGCTYKALTDPNYFKNLP